jgi:hypothetical protein
MGPHIEDSFPVEILERIVGLLDNNGLASLARVNQKFQIIAESELYEVLLLDTSRRPDPLIPCLRTIVMR